MTDTSIISSQLADNAVSTSARDLLKKFKCLQEERVETYRLFEEGFTAYLKGAPNYNFPMYRQLVHEITQTFRKISSDIISIEEKLVNQHQLQNVAKFLNMLQEEEQRKLEHTAELQMKRQEVLDYPGDDEKKVEQSQLKQSLNSSIEKINEILEELKYEAEELYCCEVDDAHTSLAER